MAKPEVKTQNEEKSLLDEEVVIAGIQTKAGIGSNKNQVLVGNGSKLEKYERYLVQIKLRQIPASQPGLPSTSIVTSARVMERTVTEKKIEPSLVNGVLKEGILGLNDYILFKDQRVPFQYWFKLGKVRENESLKATSKNILCNAIDNGRLVSYFREMLFLEYEGTKTLKEQIQEVEEMFEEIANNYNQ